MFGRTINDTDPRLLPYIVVLRVKQVTKVVLRVKQVKLVEISYTSKFTQSVSMHTTSLLALSEKSSVY